MRAPERNCHKVVDWSSTERQECVEKLRRERPDVAIMLRLEQDEYFQWDGDGPDPKKSGFQAYTVFVRAQCIVQGRLFEGMDSLCGSYFRYKESLKDVHGYLPQMIEEAVERMDRRIIETFKTP